MREDFPKQEITIYHKNSNNYTRYNVIASVRNTSIINRTNTGVTNVDNAVIRIFEEDKQTYEISKEDVIVNCHVEDTIQVAPLTELQKKYGKDNVYSVVSIDKFLLGEVLDHVKIGAK